MPLDPRRNRLLAGLSDAAYGMLARRLRPMTFGSRYAFFRDGQPIHDAFFILDGGVSLTTTLSDGFSVENAMIGREGVVGLTADLQPAPSFGVAVGQIPGEAVQCDLAAIRETAEAHPAFRHQLSLFIDQIAAEAHQSAACLARHPVQARLARWLLRCHDRVGRDEIPLTQEFIGEMLGTQRSTVSVVAGELETRGLIRYARGRVIVVDRAGLEAAACECYAALRRREVEVGIDPLG